MFSFYPEDRLTIDEIKEHPWYVKEVPTKEEVVEEFK